MICSWNFKKRRYLPSVLFTVELYFWWLSVFLSQLFHHFPVAATTFYKEQSVMDFMVELFERDRDFDLRRPMQDAIRRKFAKEIKGYIRINLIIGYMYLCGVNT